MYYPITVLFINSVIHSFNHSFIHSFNHSFIHSFIHSCPILHIYVTIVPFCVGRFRGHGVAGRYIVVLGHSCRMFGCLGNLVITRDGFSHADSVATPHHEVGSQFGPGALASRCTKIISVVIVLYCELPEL